MALRPSLKGRGLIILSPISTSTSEQTLYGWHDDDEDRSLGSLSNEADSLSSSAEYWAIIAACEDNIRSIGSIIDAQISSTIVSDDRTASNRSKAGEEHASIRQTGYVRGHRKNPEQTARGWITERIDLTSSSRHSIFSRQRMTVEFDLSSFFRCYRSSSTACNHSAAQTATNFALTDLRGATMTASSTTSL